MLSRVALGARQEAGRPGRAANRRAGICKEQRQEGLITCWNLGLLYPGWNKSGIIYQYSRLWISSNTTA